MRGPLHLRSHLYEFGCRLRLRGYLRVRVHVRRGHDRGHGRGRGHGVHVRSRARACDHGGDHGGGDRRARRASANASVNEKRAVFQPGGHRAGNLRHAHARACGGARSHGRPRRSTQRTDKPGHALARTLQRMTAGDPIPLVPSVAVPRAPREFPLCRADPPGRKAAVLRTPRRPLHLGPAPEEWHPARGPPEGAVSGVVVRT